MLLPLLLYIPLLLLLLLLSPIFLAGPASASVLCSVGDKVSGWYPDGKYYRATITGIDVAGGFFTLTWEDGDPKYRLVAAPRVLKQGVPCAVPKAPGERSGDDDGAQAESEKVKKKEQRGNTTKGIQKKTKKKKKKKKKKSNSAEGTFPALFTHLMNLSNDPDESSTTSSEEADFPLDDLLRELAASISAAGETTLFNEDDLSVDNEISDLVRRHFEQSGSDDGQEGEEGREDSSTTATRVPKKKKKKKMKKTTTTTKKKVKLSNPRTSLPVVVGTKPTVFPSTAEARAAASSPFSHCSLVGMCSKRHIRQQKPCLDAGARWFGENGGVCWLERSEDDKATAREAERLRDGNAGLGSAAEQTAEDKAEENIERVGSAKARRRRETKNGPEWTPPATTIAATLDAAVGSPTRGVCSSLDGPYCMAVNKMATPVTSSYLSESAANTQEEGEGGGEAGGKLSSILDMALSLLGLTGEDAAGMGLTVLDLSNGRAAVVAGDATGFDAAAGGEQQGLVGQIETLLQGNGVGTGVTGRRRGGRGGRGPSGERSMSRKSDSGAFHSDAIHLDPEKTPPQGVFEMKGSLRAWDGRVSLYAGRWLHQPEGWVTVGLSGRASTLSSLLKEEGDVNVNVNVSGSSEKQNEIAAKVVVTLEGSIVDEGVRPWGQNLDGCTDFTLRRLIRRPPSSTTSSSPPSFSSSPSSSSSSTAKVKYEESVATDAVSDHLQVYQDLLAAGELTSTDDDFTVTAASMNGLWIGEYTCFGVRTELRLTLSLPLGPRPMADGAGKGIPGVPLSAVFSFSPPSSTLAAAASLFSRRDDEVAGAEGDESDGEGEGEDQIEEPQERDEVDAVAPDGTSGKRRVTNRRDQARETRAGCRCLSRWSYEDTVFLGGACGNPDGTEEEWCAIVEGSCDGTPRGLNWDYCVPLSSRDSAVDVADEYRVSGGGGEREEQGDDSDGESDREESFKSLLDDLIEGIANQMIATVFGSNPGLDVSWSQSEEIDGEGHDDDDEDEEEKEELEDILERLTQRLGETETMTSFTIGADGELTLTEIDPETMTEIAEALTEIDAETFYSSSLFDSDSSSLFDSLLFDSEWEEGEAEEDGVGDGDVVELEDE